MGQSPDTQDLIAAQQAAQAAAAASAHPPPPNYYNSGPSRMYTSSRQSAPPDPWAGVAGAVHDQAVALVEKFLASVGWPGNLDANNLALLLARSGVLITSDPFGAYNWLFGALNQDQRNMMPWGRYGMAQDDYLQTISKLNAVAFDWVGGELDPDRLDAAIRGGWTPDQIRNSLMYGNPQGTGSLLAVAQMGGDMPWLSQGQTYTQTLHGFEAAEQQAPADRATLAAWFRFGVGAKTIGGGAEARGQASQQRLQASEVR